MCSIHGPNAIDTLLLHVCAVPTHKLSWEKLLDDIPHGMLTESQRDDGKAAIALYMGTPEERFRVFRGGHKDAARRVHWLVGLLPGAKLIACQRQVGKVFESARVLVHKSSGAETVAGEACGDFHHLARRQAGGLQQQASAQRHIAVCPRCRQTYSRAWQVAPVKRHAMSVYMALWVGWARRARRWAARQRSQERCRLPVQVRVA